MTREQLVALVRASSAQKVKIAVADIDGVLRGKYIHKEKFLSALDGGLGFCNVIFGWDCGDVAYDNAAYTGWHSGYPDAQARLDLGTYRTIPWENNVPFFLGDFEDGQGNALPICPRQLLRRVIARASGHGLRAQFGVEFEWFNFRETPGSLREHAFAKPEPITPGMFGYSLTRAGQNRDFFTAIMDELLAFRVPVEGLHTETGPGVYEAAILYSDPLEAGDRATLFKASVKEIGHRFGIMPTFMAKWNEKLPGCSGHMHQSLLDEAGNNLFYEAAAPHRMSAVFKSYLAGQMRLLPEILPMFAPTINSYKRLVEGAWAPTRVNWGADNRTVAFRVIPASKKSTRLETRVGGSDINPYLAIAAALASGLYGIENKLELPHPPVVGNGYRDEKAEILPRNLEEASNRMAASKVARELFGDAFVDHFTSSRIWEWRQFQSAVTTWERERYFEII
ncbi:MAG: glutamine synthetase family protein [Polyangiaceae bacterium]